MPGQKLLWSAFWFVLVSTPLLSLVVPRTVFGQWSWSYSMWQDSLGLLLSLAAGAFISGSLFGLITGKSDVEIVFRVFCSTLWILSAYLCLVLIVSFYNA